MRHSNRSRSGLENLGQLAEGLTVVACPVSTRLERRIDRVATPTPAAVQLRYTASAQRYRVKLVTPSVSSLDARVVFYRNIRKAVLLWDHAYRKVRRNVSSMSLTQTSVRVMMPYDDCALEEVKDGLDDR